MKVMIAVPCMDTLPVQFVESMMYMDKPEGTSVCFKPNSLVYDSRNLLSLTAIENGYDYVMWLDSDMIVPHNTLTRLLKVIDNYGADMVTGLYVTRSANPEPVLFDCVDPPQVLESKKMLKKVHRYYRYPRDSVFKIDGCGFGCVLTSVKLLKEVWDKFGPAFAPFPWAGEDVAFCWRVKQLQRPILCDSTVKCGHVGTFVYHEGLLKREVTVDEEH